MVSSPKCNLTNPISLFIALLEVQSEDPESPDKNFTVPRSEVIKRLRDRGHPILLFGESEQQSFKRLRRIEIQEPEANKV